MTAYVLSTEVKKKIDHWLAKFPADQKRSATLPALHIVQEADGFLSDAAMQAIAEYLGLPHIAVYEVATFYSMYDLKPTARHKINVCTNISCMLRDAESIVQHIKNRLGVGFNEVTEDGQFILKEVECMAACCNAPMMQIDKQYYLDLTPERVDQILDSIE